MSHGDDGALRDAPWSLWTPGPNDPWDAEKVAHLHRRTGFGAQAADFDRDLADGHERAIERRFEPTTETGFERTESILSSGVGDSVARLQSWWLHRMLSGPDPLRERLTLLWHDLFATSQRKVRSVPAMKAQNELFRQHAMAPFGRLLQAVTEDDAMLVWLDGGQIDRERPNENYAREFLELFTLGAGHFTEADVRAAARAFTGHVPWPVGATSSFRFDERAHDHESKCFLGHTGPWNSGDIIRLTLDQPQAAQHLARALYREFVADDRTEPLRHEPPIAALAELIVVHQFDVRVTMEHILRSRWFFDAKQRFARIKSPAEWSVGLVRALELPRSGGRLRALAEACAQQGQHLFHPPSVKGWDGGSAWLSSAALIARLNWSCDLVLGRPSHGLSPMPPVTSDVTARAARSLVPPDLQPSTAPNGDTLLTLLARPEAQLA